MKIKFLQDVVDNQKDIVNAASTGEIKTWALKTVSILFP